MAAIFISKATSRVISCFRPLKHCLLYRYFPKCKKLIELKFKKMTLEFSEADVIDEMRNLMNNERIQPEPHFECFSKYFASANSNSEYIEGESIFNLIKSHGVHLRNDVKYWLDKGKEESTNEELKCQVPVLNPEDFIFSDYNDVLMKLKELPSEWTIIQITKKFSSNDILRKSSANSVPEIHITKFYCGKQAERVQPYSVTVAQSSNSVENIFKTLKNLTKLRREYFSMGRTNKKLYDAYYNTNVELMNFIKELELYILKHWICLFHGRLEDSNLEDETLLLVKKLIDSFCEKGNTKCELNAQQLEIIYQVTLSSHFLKNKDIFTVLKSILYSEDCDSVNTSALMLLVENIKMLNLSKECAIKRANFKPVILILDNEFENVPWEMITPLTGQPVCRISSLQLLYALYKYHQPYIKDGFRTVEIDRVYSLVNPEKDLESCEKAMKEFLKKRVPWAEIEIGSAPDPKDLIAKLTSYSVYLYCGHGSGMQYLKAMDLKRAFVKGLVLLFGCSSNVPRNCGGRTPHQNNTYTYTINGCPCTIGCIQDVGSTDADIACEQMLSDFMPSIENEGSKVMVVEPKESNVLKSLASAKGACTRYWSKSAFVARGIPCKTIVGDRSKIAAKVS